MNLSTQDSALRSRALSALNKARNEGAEMFSVAFPTLPPQAFLNLAFSQETRLFFFFENEKKAIAEAAIGLRGESLPLRAGISLASADTLLPKSCVTVSVNSTDDRVPAPKVFLCATFDGHAVATVPRFQLSRSSAGTRLSAHLFLNDLTRESAAEIDALFNDYEKLKALSETAPQHRELPSPESVSEVGGDWYLSAARKCIRQIENGELKKIVLARAKDFSFSAQTVFPHKTLLAKLRERFLAGGCTLFYAHTNAERPEEKIIGASPEMLVRAGNGILETEAIAGTITNDGTSALDEMLFSDKKERLEHQLVIDFIVEKLKDSALNPQTPEFPEILRLPNVLHLRTPIRAELPQGKSLANIAAKLHPTPAMCGVPAEKVRKQIPETEPFPRENFSAPLGFIDADGNGFFAVAIRCAKIFGNKFRLYAGSGLVSGSVPEKEYAEIESKFAALRKLF